MPHTSWFRRPRPSRPIRRAAPRLEALEDRNLLTTIVGVTTSNNLVSVDTAKLSTVNTIGAVSGLSTGQTLAGIDFRPQTGELYGLGIATAGGVSTGQIYKINTSTAAASAVGNPFSTKLAGAKFAMEFDPAADVIRVVSDAGANLRVSPTTGSLLSIDTSLSTTDAILALGNTNNFRGATSTTVYGYDATNNNLVTIGSVGGSPNSPNGGKVSNVGASGVTAQASNLGFDIDANNTAYLSIIPSGATASELYTANLSSGALTAVGAFGATMRDITVAPAASFSITGFPPERTAGLSSTITVTAKDAFGGTANGYSGTVAFSSTDGQATLPKNSTLSSGSSSFTVAFNTAGTQSVTATDTVSTNVTGSQTNINVLPNEEFVGVTSANKLVRFYSATPSTLTTIGTISGLASGQTLVAIAFRPASGQLFGLGFAPGTGLTGGTGQLYTINPTTAAATAVASPFSTSLNGFNYDMAFDPVNDIIRITDDANENLRVNPNTGGLINNDTILTPNSSNVVAIAYDRNFLGSTTTTLYGYDLSTNNLVTIGSVNGSPNTPAGGVVTAVGSSNETVTVGTGANAGFDIDNTGGAYLNLVAGNATTGTSGLYTADLPTGGLVLNGTFGGVTMRDIAAAPAAGFAFSQLGSPRVAGAASPFTVTAVNAFGDPVSTYRGTVRFGSSDPAANLPTNTTLLNGSGTFNVIFNTTGTQTLTATDTGISSVTSTDSNITVVAAADLVGLTTSGQLVHFSSATPNSPTVVGTVSGLVVGETLVGIDFRPATSQLYGLGFASGTAQIYTIDPTTAVATPLNSSFSLSPADKSFGFGFDPVADNIRITSNVGENLRVDPTTGAVISNDTPLNPSGTYVGAAYSNNFRGATQATLYAYDFVNNRIVTIGGFNGSAINGKVAAVGATGITVSSGTAGDLGFDVGADGVAYVNLVSGGQSGLYTVNLSTGAMSLVGAVGSGLTLVGVSEAPTASFSVSGYPSPIGTNTPATFTVTAIDAYGTTVPTYNGTVTFLSTDPSAVLPADSTLTNGAGTFTASFRTVGTQSLIASDLTVTTINGAQNNIVVGNGGGGGGTSPPPPITGAGKLGVVRPNTDRSAGVTQDTNGNGVFDAGDAAFTFGLSTDKFLVGDWAGLGFDSIGVVRPTAIGVAQFSLDTNGDNAFDSGDSVFYFGLNSDTFVVGDWNGSSNTKIGVVRQGSNGVAVWSLDTNGNGVFDSGDSVFSYGLNSDTFITGDWTGSGHAQIGVVRQTASGVLQWVLNTSGGGSFGGGDTVYNFGLNGDVPVVGDWTGSGKTEIGVVRKMPDGSAMWVLDSNGDGMFDGGDSVFTFGLATDKFIVGKWRQPGQLQAADGFLNGPPVAPLTIDPTFVSTVHQAIAAWQQAGLDSADVSRLYNVNYSVANLGGATLGESLGNSITIDATAAGHGWSQTPTPAPGQEDLFTVLAHEMGHTLGLDHSSQPGDVMYESLAPGVRKAPTTADVDALFASLGSRG
jgi:hypothetical protein